MHQRESSEVWLRTSSRVKVFAGGAIVGEMDYEPGEEGRRKDESKKYRKKEKGSMRRGVDEKFIRELGQLHLKLTPRRLISILL